MATRVFPSKKDLWISLLLGFAFLAMFATSYGAFFDPEAGAARFPLLALALGAAGFVLWTWLATRYVIDGDLLTVHAGPFRYRIPIRTIDRVRPTRNPLSSPALSLDRLDIRYEAGRRRIMISPDDKRAFLRALNEADPDLRIRGEELIREANP